MKTSSKLCFRNEHEMHLFLMHISATFSKGFPQESINAYALHSTTYQLKVSPSNTLQQENQYQCEG